MFPGVFRLDEGAGVEADGKAQVLGVEEFLQCDTEAGSVEWSKEESVLAVGQDGLDGLGARCEDRELLGHEFEEFNR